MPQWLQDLGPEYYILFGLVVLSFLLIILVVIMQTKTNKILINRSIVLKDAIHKSDQGLKVVVDLANQSYVNAEIVEVGFFYKKTYIPIYEERFIITARDFFKVEYSAEELRALLLGNQKQVKKLYVYIKNTVGDIIKVKAKLVKKHLVNTINEEIRLAKLAAKTQRFETGNYNFWERFGLVLAFIFSPFYKLFKFIARKTNESMKRRQARLAAKRKIEAEHKELRDKETEKMVAEIEAKEREKYQKNLEREEKLKQEEELKKAAKAIELESTENEVKPEVETPKKKEKPAKMKPEPKTVEEPVTVENTTNMEPQVEPLDESENDANDDQKVETKE